MSARATGLVWKHSAHKGSDLLVLLAIADHAKDDGRDAWPSVESLAEKTRLTERNVRYVIRRLEASGELECERNAGPRGANLYHLCLGDAKIAPAKIAPAKISSEEFSGGQHSVSGGGNTAYQGGAIAIAPKPSLRTVKEPEEINNAQCVRENLPRARAHEATFSPMHPDLPPDQLVADAAACGTTPAIYRGQIAQWADKRRAQGTARADWRADLRSFVRASLEIGAVRASPARASPAGARPVTFAEQRDRNTDAAIDEVRALIEGGNGNGSRAVSGRDEAGRCRLSGGPDDPDPRGVLGAVARGGGRGVPRGGVAGD